MESAALLCNTTGQLLASVGRTLLKTVHHTHLRIAAHSFTAGERIIGVTDPDDDTLVIWGIIREGEPPKQLVAGGEFFTLKRVERVPKVGDVLGISLVPE